MRIVVALGGNALLKRGEPPTAENQRRNVRIAADALAPLARDAQLIITHGNGPQVGLLALQGTAYDEGAAYPLDVLDAETEGQIGYLIEQELRNALRPGRPFATLLTQIEVDPKDPAFDHPTKPIGPFYDSHQAHALERAHGWRFAASDGAHRRVVASPRPRRIFQLDVIALLVEAGVVVICAGGGGIPTVVGKDGRLIGAEAVIDKDAASALLARELQADAFLMLTDVDGVYAHWGEPGARRIRRISPVAIGQFSFAPGSMAPKVAAACSFAEATGGITGIGALEDAAAILNGEAGTRVSQDADEARYWD